MSEGYIQRNKYAVKTPKNTQVVKFLTTTDRHSSVYVFTTLHCYTALLYLYRMVTVIVVALMRSLMFGQIFVLYKYC